LPLNKKKTIHPSTSYVKKDAKIRYKKWRPVEEREVQWSEIKKGYEVTKNNYVVLEKEEIDKIKLRTTNTIEISEFMEAKDFDRIFVEKTTLLDLTQGRKKWSQQLRLTLYLSRYFMTLEK
jgi:DNA end-binding protein Ku